MLTTTVFAVSSLQCGSSKDTIENKVLSLPGVVDAEVSIFSKTMTVTYDDEKIREKDIIKATASCGYDAFVPIEDTEIIGSNEEEKDPPLPKVCIVLCLLILVMKILHLFSLYALFPAIGVFILSKDLLWKGFKDITKKKKNDDAMISLIAASGIVLGFTAIFMERDGTMFFFASAVSLTLHTIFTDRISLHKQQLMKQLSSDKKLPQHARLYEDYKEDSVRLDLIKKDSVIVLRPHDVVPADGTVIVGQAMVDESRLSGKAQSVSKHEGSRLYANSIIVDGSLTMCVQETGDTTTMMRIQNIAEKTTEMHQFASPLADFGKYLFFYMITASVLTFGGWFFLKHDILFAAAAALSVMACEAMSAFQLISSSAVIKTVSKAAKEHILFRNINSLSMLTQIDTMLIEQDGFITKCDPVVTDFIPAADVSLGRLEYVAYALLSSSSQPLPRAIMKYLRTQKIKDLNMNDFKRFNMNGRRNITSIGKCVCGTPMDLQEKGIDLKDWDEKIQELHHDGKRVMLFAENGEVLGLAASRKPLLEHAHDAVKVLKEKGIRVTLITNGAQFEGEYLQRIIEPDEILIQPTRTAKEKQLISLRDQNIRTAFISKDTADSVSNMTDLSIAVDCGTDIDRERCGILLTRDDPQDLVKAVQYAEDLSTKIEKQQFTAIVYHIVMMLLAAWAVPMFLKIPMPILIPLLLSGCAAMWVQHKNA